MSTPSRFAFGISAFGVGSFGGVDVSTAIKAILEAGLIPFVTYAASQTIFPGYVISQTPAAGAVVPANTQVVLVVSEGYSGGVGSTTVPNLVGLVWKAATDTLQAANLSNDKYLWKANAAAAGTVLTQSVAAGSNVVPGALVQLTLSAGPARVPATASVPVAS